MAGEQQKWSLCLEKKVVQDSYCIISVTLVFKDLFKFRKRSYSNREVRGKRGKK